MRRSPEQELALKQVITEVNNRFSESRAEFALKKSVVPIIEPIVQMGLRA